MNAAQLLASGLPTAETVWGLLPRFIGAVFILAHATLVPTALGLIGKRGITPVQPRLEALRRDFPGWRRFWEFPSLLWLNCSDNTIRALPWIGIAGGIAAIGGGTAGWCGMLLAMLTYRSLESMGLGFPWDMFLLEAAFVSLLLPVTPTLPSVALAALPSPLVALLMQWLVIRLMWGFAKLKFIGTRKGDIYYLKSFFIWLPLPNPLGYFAYFAPKWFHRVSLRMMFVVEVILPGLALFPGWPRLVAYAGFVMLMLGIQATGNWGFFNISYILIAACLLDLNVSVFTPFNTTAPLFQTPITATTNILALLIFAFSAVQFLFNTWMTRAWVYWPLLDALSARFAALRPIVALLRAVSPLHLINAYGVFPPNSWPALRQTAIFEGSDDGVTWLPYRYRHLPCHEQQRPATIAPWHPRFDQGAAYFVSGMSDTALMGSVVGNGSPLSTYLRYTMMDRVMQRLLEGERNVVALFANNPFPDKPPQYMRLSCYAMVATSPAEVRQTGRWWRMRRVGALANATGKNPEVWRRYTTEPELFHPDFLYWKKRAPAMQRIAAAWHSTHDADRAILACPGVCGEDVTRFWQEFIPHVTQQPLKLSEFRQQALALAQRFSPEQLHQFERILERYAWILRLALDPHRIGGAAPRLPRMPNFRFHLVLHALIADGRAPFYEYLKTPSVAVSRSAAFEPVRQLQLVSLLRYDVIEFSARIARWSLLKQALATEIKLPSALEYFELLATIVPSDEDWVPEPQQDDEGIWSLDTDGWPTP